MPPIPTVSGPESTIFAGKSFTLNCMSPDTTRPIMWSLMGTTITPGTNAEIMGQFGTSVLTVTNVQLENGGMYMCHVGRTVQNFLVNVAMAPTTDRTSKCL